MCNATGVMLDFAESQRLVCQPRRIWRYPDITSLTFTARNAKNKRAQSQDRRFPAQDGCSLPEVQAAGICALAQQTSHQCHHQNVEAMFGDIHQAHQSIPIQAHVGLSRTRR